MTNHIMKVAKTISDMKVDDSTKEAYAYDEAYAIACEQGEGTNDQYMEEVLEELLFLIDEDNELTGRMTIPDYVPLEWVERARIEHTVMQFLDAERDYLTELETINYYVIPTSHVDMVPPDSWEDVREGEGRLKEEREQVLYRRTSMWETFAWGNAVDTDDFQKGPAIGVDDRGNQVLAAQDAWEMVIADALGNMQFADKCYAGDR